MKNLLILSRFEFKKLFIRKALMIMTIILCFLNVLNICRHFDVYQDPAASDGRQTTINSARYTLYQIYGGELTDEKISEINALYSQALYTAQPGNFHVIYDPDKYYSGYEYGDANLFIELGEEINRLSGYHDMISSTAASAEEKNQNPTLNAYYRNINNDLINIYRDREITLYRNNGGMNDFFDYRLSSVLSIIMVIVGAVMIFTADREAGTDIYLSSSVNGSGKSAAAKLLAAAYHTFLINLIFFAADLAAFMIIMRIDGITMPLYSLENYAYTPYGFTIWQYAVIYFLFRLGGLLCIAFISSLITVLLKKPAISMISSIALFIVMLLMKTYLVTDKNRMINLINPLVLMTAPEYMRSYDALNVFSRPVQYIFVSTLCITLTAAAAAVVTVIAAKMRGGKNIGNA